MSESPRVRYYCRACQAEVLFVRLPDSDDPVAVDLRPVVRIRILDDSDLPVADPAPDAYVLHSSTCPSKEFETRVDNPRIEFDRTSANATRSRRRMNSAKIRRNQRGKPSRPDSARGRCIGLDPDRAPVWNRS